MSFALRAKKESYTRVNTWRTINLRWECPVISSAGSGLCACPIVISEPVTCLLRSCERLEQVRSMVPPPIMILVLVLSLSVAVTDNNTVVAVAIEV